MRDHLDLSLFSKVCTGIANEVAEDSGFVSARNLLSRFGATLIIRPLLVEGMLAKIDGDKGASRGSQWAVLIDREKYPVDLETVDAETQERPLPVRMRFTIAHELAHSLAYRPSEFGVHLQPQRNKQSKSAFVEAIERETDRLSSLLLWPERAVAAFLTDESSRRVVEPFAKLARQQGISRYVLLNRLRTFQSTDDRGLLQRTGLRNIGVGLGEWTQGRKAVLRNWPLFFNFERNIIPDPLLKVARQDRTPASAVFPDPSFVLCGGDSTEMRFHCVTDAAVPGSEMVPLTVTVEKTDGRVGSSFLYVVSRTSGSVPRGAASLQQDLLQDVHSDLAH